MITISNVPALRVAMHLTGPAGTEPRLQTILLAKDGTLKATNGFAIIVSEHAHDASEDTYLTFDGKPKLQKSTRSATIAQGALTEHGGRTKMHPVRTDREGTLPSMQFILDKLTGDELAEPFGPIDCIKAAKIAEAYGLDAPQGTWLPTPNAGLVHLSHARETDTILLVPVQVGNANRYARKAATEPAPQPTPQPTSTSVPRTY